MANIGDKINKIRNAIFGHEVRDSIADGIKGINEEVENTTQRQTDLETQFDVVLDETTGKDVISAPEITAARVDKSNKTYANLKERLDQENAEVKTHLAEKPTYNESRLRSQLIGSNDVTQELLNFGSGGPINVLSVPKIQSTNPGQTTFFKKSTNLFNRYTATPTVIADDGQGTENPSENYITSKFELAEPGKTYRFESVNRVVWYDIDFNFISLRFVNTASYTATAPDNAFRMRASTQNGYLLKAQINLGTELLPYEDYYEYLSEQHISNVSAQKVTGLLSHKQLSKLGKLGILFSNNKPNINLINKTIELTQNFYVLVDNQRFNFNDDTGATISIPLDSIAQYQFLVFNTATENFRAVKTTLESTLSDYDVILQSLQFNSGLTELTSAWTTCEITVNGIDYYEYLYSDSNTVDNKMYQFVPEVPSYTYEADTLPAADGTTDFDHSTSTSADVYSKIDDLVSSHSSYISKTLLGNDATNTLPIYLLELNPETAIANSIRKPLPTIIINCAMHGDGNDLNGDGSPGDPPTHAYSLYYFIKELCENWKSSKALEYLRWNVRFVIIPISNPWGFDNKSRYNADGIDINRDFDAFQAIESQYIRDVYSENKNAILSIDFHMIGGLDYIADSSLMRYFINTHDDASYQVCEQTIRKLSRQWQGNYDLTNQLFYGRASLSGESPSLRGWGFYKIGIPTFTLEGFLATNSHREKSGSVAMTMNVEHLGNLLMNVIRYFYDK